MANRRIKMKQIREIIKYGRLLSCRKIAALTGVSRPVVSDYLKAAEKAGLTNEKAARMADSALIEALAGEDVKPEAERTRRLKERFPGYVKRLKQKGMTLRILWAEYKGEDPQGYAYSRFCEMFYEYRQEDSVSMHLDHKVGDKAFFDFAGEKLTIHDRNTGKETACEFFVGILGASQLTYAEAVESQKIHDVRMGTENALRFFGGAPAAVVFDCLRAAVTKGSRYEPITNEKLDHFFEYYDTVNLPARPKHPKDKALVEGVVKILYTRIYTELRKKKFFSLKDLNKEIHRLLEHHNNTLLTNLQVSRRELYEETERDALKPLPSSPYEVPTFADRNVAADYHILLSEDRHCYSVPYRFAKKMARIVANQSTVEIFIDGLRVATHLRNRKPGYTTVPDHRPAHHRFVDAMTPEHVVEMARNKSEEIGAYVGQILEVKKHPEQGCKASLGVIRLTDKYSVERVSRACMRATHFKSYSYRTIKEILEKDLDTYEADLTADDRLQLPEHDNVRGSDYYDTETAANDEVNGQEATHQEVCNGN